MLSFFISSALAAETPNLDHEGSAFPPFDASTFASQIFWLAVTFGALYLLMSRVALPRMAGILETRAQRIASDIDQASAMQAKAQEAGAAYEQALAKAKASAQEIGQKAKEEAAAVAAERRKTVEAEMAAKVASAESQIAATKAGAMTNVSGIAADAASAIVERLTGKAPPAADLKAALDTALPN